MPCTPATCLSRQRAGASSGYGQARQHLRLAMVIGTQDQCFPRAGVGVCQIGEHKHVGEPHLEATRSGRSCRKCCTQFFQMGCARRLWLAVGRPERCPDLWRAKRKRRAVHAAAPRARQDFAWLELSMLKPGAYAASLGSAFVAQVALGAAVAQAEPRGVERARGQRVAEGCHHPALAQQCFGARILRCPAAQAGPGQPGAQHRSACNARFRRQAGRHTHCPKLPCGQRPGTGSGSRPAWRCWR